MKIIIPVDNVSIIDRNDSDVSRDEPFEAVRSIVRGDDDRVPSPAPGESLSKIFEISLNSQEKD